MDAILVPGGFGKRGIEGMLIAGYAVGATEAYIYVRAEYPLAVSRLRKAIRAATAAASGMPSARSAASMAPPCSCCCCASPGCR